MVGSEFVHETTVVPWLSSALQGQSSTVSRLERCPSRNSPVVFVCIGLSCHQALCLDNVRLTKIAREGLVVSSVNDCTHSKVLYSSM